MRHDIALSVTNMNYEYISSRVEKSKAAKPYQNINRTKTSNVKLKYYIQ